MADVLLPPQANTHLFHWCLFVQVNIFQSLFLSRIIHQIIKTLLLNHIAVSFFYLAGRLVASRNLEFVSKCVNRLVMVGSGKRSFKVKELGIMTQHHETEEEKRKGVRRGCLAIKVGREEKERIEVPVSYLKHPLFVELLKEAEEEYGFEQEGAIAIPCQLKHFKCVEAIIHREQYHHHRLVGCFRL